MITYKNSQNEEFNYSNSQVAIFHKGPDYFINFDGTQRALYINKEYISKEDLRRLIENKWIYLKEEVRTKNTCKHCSGGDKCQECFFDRNEKWVCISFRKSFENKIRNTIKSIDDFFGKECTKDDLQYIPTELKNAISSIKEDLHYFVTCKTVDFVKIRDQIPIAFKFWDKEKMMNTKINLIESGKRILHINNNGKHPDYPQKYSLCDAKIQHIETGALFWKKNYIVISATDYDKGNKIEIEYEINLPQNKEFTLKHVLVYFPKMVELNLSFDDKTKKWNIESYD